MCGFCEEEPELLGNVFQKYAKGHYQNTSIKVRWLISKEGPPSCSNCGSALPDRSILRGAPRFCSHRCGGLYNKETVLAKMRPKIIAKYAEDPDYRKKISNGVRCTPKAAERDKKRGETVRKKHEMDPSLRERKRVWTTDSWKDPVVRQSRTEGIRKGTNTLLERARRKEYGELHGLTNINKYVSSLSKLHVKIRSLLGLQALGFVSEQTLGRFQVDELHLGYGIIIEINGDYVHANPKKYGKDCVICIGSEPYLAQDKWDRDKRRKEWLERKGYIVLAIWESDDMTEWSATIKDVLSYREQWLEGLS